MEDLSVFAMACKTKMLHELADDLCADLKQARFEDPFGLKPWGAVCCPYLYDDQIRAMVLDLLGVIEDNYLESQGMVYIRLKEQKVIGAAYLQSRMQESIVEKAAVILFPYVEKLVANSFLSDFEPILTIPKSEFIWNVDILKRALDKLQIESTADVVCLPDHYEVDVCIRGLDVGSG